MARLDQALARQDGLTVYMQPVQDLTIGGPREPHAVPDDAVQSRPESAERVDAKLVDRLRQVPGLKDVTDDLQDDGLQTWVEIDRDAASRLGITAAVIDDTLYDAYGQRQISTIFTQLNQYRVVLEVAPEFQMTPASLGQIHIPPRRAARCRCRPWRTSQRARLCWP